MSDEQQGGEPSVRERREQAIASRYPDLVRPVRLSDPLSSIMRREGWAPAAMFPEALLRARFRDASPGEKAALSCLSAFAIQVLAIPASEPVLTRALTAPAPPTRARDALALIARIRAAVDGPDPGGALGQVLQAEAARIRETPLDAREIGWAHTRTVAAVVGLFGDHTARESELTMALVKALDRAAMCLSGDTQRPECLVGADELGLVHRDIGDLTADDQAAYRYLAARTLPEVLNDGRAYLEDLPGRPEEWGLISPEVIDRLLARTYVDRELIGYFEDELARRKRYELSRTTEIEVAAGGMARVVFTPPRSYARKMIPGGGIDIPTRYLPVVIVWESGARDFASLIIAHGVGPEATVLESTLLSSAARMRPSDGPRLALALRGLLLACYRDLVVADVREAHYRDSPEERPRSGRERKRARKRSGRARLLPRIVYEGRERSRRRAAGEPPAPRMISAHIRRLPSGAHASDEVAARAGEWDVRVPDGYTFVRPFWRPKAADARQERELERPVYRSWSAYDLITGAWREGEDGPES